MTLEEQIQDLLNLFSGDVTLYAKNLASQEEVALREDEIHRCASESKIFILLTLAEQISSGELDPNLCVELEETEIVPGSGVIRFANPGLQPSVLFLAYLMMCVSDNTATNMLMDVVGGPGVIQATVDRLGIPHTTIHGKVWQSDGDWIASSARGLARAAEIIAKPGQYNYPSAAAELCKKIMAHHFEDNGIVRFLPWSPFAADIKDVDSYQHVFENYTGIQYYGKAGYTPGYRGDSALFISGKSSYVVGLKCRNIPGGKPLNAANEGFTFSANVGRLLYQHWG